MQAHPPPRPHGVPSHHLPHTTAPSRAHPNLCLSQQTPDSAPSTRHRRPAAPGHRSHVLPCPGVHQCGPASGYTDPTLPPAHPDRRPEPASHGYLARRHHRLHASAEALVEWPAHLPARSPRVPRLPFLLALHGDAPPKHPWACLPAPSSPPPPLPAMALPRSLIHVGRPPAMAPGTLVPHSHPRTLTSTAPAGSSRKPPAVTASTRRVAGAPFLQGTRLCPDAPERAALASRRCPLSAVHSPTPPPRDTVLQQS